LIGSLVTDLTIPKQKTQISVLLLKNRRDGNLRFFLMFCHWSVVWLKLVLKFDLKFWLKFDTCQVTFSNGISLKENKHRYIRNRFWFSQAQIFMYNLLRICDILKCIINVNIDSTSPLLPYLATSFLQLSVNYNDNTKHTAHGNWFAFVSEQLIENISKVLKNFHRNNVVF
jgi:hypothetical protein